MNKMMPFDKAAGICKKVIPEYEKLSDADKAAYNFAAEMCEQEKVLEKVYNISQKKVRFYLFHKRNASNPAILENVLFYSAFASFLVQASKFKKKEYAS